MTEDTPIAAIHVYVEDGQVIVRADDGIDTLTIATLLRIAATYVDQQLGI